MLHLQVKTRELNSIPVMGWESKKCHANGPRLMAYDPETNQDPYYLDSTEKKASRYNTLSNAGKLLGAFPLVTGQIIGLARIITTITGDRYLYGANDDGHRPLLNKAKHIARGLTEIAGLGVVWFALDALATAGRFFARLQKLEPLIAE